MIWELWVGLRKNCLSTDYRKMENGKIDLIPRDHWPTIRMEPLELAENVVFCNLTGNRIFCTVKPARQCFLLMARLLDELVEDIPSPMETNPA